MQSPCIGSSPASWTPHRPPANELAALYHDRWEIENALDELKTHLWGTQIVLRSKQPDLVRQEFYGLMMAHFAICGLMYEAALKAEWQLRMSCAFKELYGRILAVALCFRPFAVACLRCS